MEIPQEIKDLVLDHFDRLQTAYTNKLAWSQLAEEVGVPGVFAWAKMERDEAMTAVLQHEESMAKYLAEGDTGSAQKCVTLYFKGLYALLVEHNAYVEEFYRARHRAEPQQLRAVVGA